MDAPEVSIVIPVYNVDLWISECLDSIRGQSFTKWECILVDDGSRDLSGIICDSYARSDHRFKVIHQKNAGVSAARNAGIELAVSPLLAFIDPDDFISENYFDALIFELRRVDADVAVSRIILTEENGKEGKHASENYLQSKINKLLPVEMRCNDAVIEALCDNQFSCVSWCKVFTRQIWGNARFPLGIDLGEDMMTVPPVIVKANSAVAVYHAVYYWRQRRKSLLHGTVTKDRFTMDLKASKEMYKRLCEYAPDKQKAFKDLKLQYDVGCEISYLKSNPGIRRGSFLYELRRLRAEIEEQCNHE